MATFNGAKHILDQLNDLAAQTHLPAELVICDDLSSDETLAIVERFAASAPFPVRIHRNPEWLGYRANFMKAAGLCSLDLIAFCDQDDRWDQRKLELLSEPFADEKVLLAYHNATVINPSGRRLGAIYGRRGRTMRPLSTNPWFFPLGFTQVFRRSLLLFDELWRQSRDPHAPTELLAHDQWYFMLASALGEIAYIPISLAHYRRHSTNVSGVSWNWLHLRRLTELVRARRERRQRLAAATNRAYLFRQASMQLKGQWHERANEAARWYDALSVRGAFSVAWHDKFLTNVANRIPQIVRPPLRWLWARTQRNKVLRRELPQVSRPHGLSRELIVSLTSYPARFATLHLTLRSLLLQSVKPDRLILWIAQQDFPALPDEVLLLRSFGLEIRRCDDLRSFKKLIPTLEAYPRAFIATADDDLYYPSDWLQVLVETADEEAIIARRVVRLKHYADGVIAPFSEWAQDVSDAAARRPSVDIMPETGAGALFPPGSLHPMVTDRALFQRLCPDSDDLWFYWCARAAGTPIKKVGDSLIITGWPGTQVSNLWNSNRRGGNDRMIRALEGEFGVESLGPVAR